MPAVFHLTILSSDKKIFEDNVQSLIAPGEVGYLGILANHAPLMTALIPGRITTRDSSGKPKSFDAETGGFLEVSNNKAVILLDDSSSYL